MPLHSSTHCPCRRTNNAIVHQDARVVHVSSSHRYRFSSAHVRTATALCASPNKQEGLTELESSRESDLKPVSNSQNSENDSSNSNRLILLAGLVAAAAIILYSSGGFAGLKERVQDLEVLVGSSGYLGPLIFVGSYATATVLFFPASLLTLAAGYLFGPVKGTALVSVSATLGACLAFLISRYIARPTVEAKLAENPKFQAVYNNISRDGAKLVLLLRLSPLIPFSLLNYGLGITKVGFLEYAVASWAGMLPGTFAYVYLGSLGKVAADAADSGAAGGFDGIKLALYGVGAVATIWATKLISNAASAAIDDDKQQAQ